MIIAIDFDGTIVESRFPEIGSLFVGAKESINALHDAEHYIIIWTCRTGDRLTEAINFLLENGIKFDRINEHCPENLKKYGSSSRKVYAHCYIDDKNIGGFPGWEICVREIAKMEKEYQQSTQNPKQSHLSQSPTQRELDFFEKMFVSEIPRLTQMIHSTKTILKSDADGKADGLGSFRVEYYLLLEKEKNMLDTYGVTLSKKDSERKYELAKKLNGNL